MVDLSRMRFDADWHSLWVATSLRATLRNVGSVVGPASEEKVKLPQAFEAKGEKVLESKCSATLQSGCQNLNVTCSAVAGWFPSGPSATKTVDMSLSRMACQSREGHSN